MGVFLIQVVVALEGIRILSPHTIQYRRCFPDLMPVNGGPKQSEGWVEHRHPMCNLHVFFASVC